MPRRTISVAQRENDKDRDNVLGGVTLNRNVGQLVHRLQSRAQVGKCGACGDADYGGVSGRADAPDVQVNDKAIARPLDLLRDFRHEMRICGVEQHRRRVPHQAPGPAGDDDSTHNSHDRIKPYPACKAPGDQRDNGQHRRERVCEDMKIGGAQIVICAAFATGVIVMIVVMIGITMGVIVMVSVMVSSARQEQCAEKIDPKPDHSDDDGLVEGHG